MSVTGIRWAGPRAVLVELSDLSAVLSLQRRLLAEPLPGQTDTVGASATVLVKFAAHQDALNAREAIPALHLEDLGHGSGRELTIEVVYDGEDLLEVADLTGLSPEGVIQAHTGQQWSAAFGGFAPGFAYLLGQNGSLDVPRRSTPRTAVPAGSIALAGGYSAVYPRQSPGGWQLIGRTEARMWDLRRETPALVRPGDTVRFVAVRSVTHTRDTASEAPQEPVVPNSGEVGLVVEAAGLQSLLQDLGRPGWGDLGVSAAGAADTQAARQANRILGNAAGDAVVENLRGGLVVRAQGDQVVAVAGATVPLEIRGERQEVLRRPPICAPFPLLDGQTLSLGEPVRGLRSYLAVRGGIDVPPVLGSRSTDSMSGIGPAALAAGSFLAAAPVQGARPVGSAEASTLRPEKSAPPLRVTLGPRDDWFAGEALEALFGREWLITEQSNRIGLRLRPSTTTADDSQGGILDRCRFDELPSEGAVSGALQVPPNGNPVLFLADHPVTGGYPVIGVVIHEDLPAAAQLVPGSRVRFAPVDPTTLEPLKPEPAPATAPEGSQP